MNAKIAVLRLFLAVAMSANAVLAFMMPSVIEEIMAVEMEGSGAISEWLLLVFAFFWLIPLTMAFLSLTPKDSVNRWANIIVGIVFVAIGVLSSSDTLIRGQLAPSLMEVSKTLVAPPIVRHAWKWRKHEV